MKPCLLALLLACALPALAGESEPTSVAAAETRVHSSHGLLKQLEKFMDQRQAAVGELNAAEAVGLMVDWMRFSPVASAEDSLLYQYGGWSEGCATAFKLSVLRKVVELGADGASVEHLAGITLMYEPSSQSEFTPYKAASSGAKTLEGFVQSIEASPAFVALGTQKPMASMLETGGIR